MIDFIKDYGELAIGAAFLLVAASVLPSGIKRYVLTAGLAVLGYMAYQRFSNRGRMADTDAERDRLRETAEVYQARGAELAKKVEALDADLERKKAAADELDRERAQLQAAGGNVAGRLAELNRESDLVLADIESRRKEREEATARWAAIVAAERAAREKTQP
jgi:chromosome segregation ATPase